MWLVTINAAGQVGSIEKQDPPKKELAAEKKMLEIALCQSCNFMAGSLIVHNFQNWKEI